MENTTCLKRDPKNFFAYAQSLDGKKVMVRAINANDKSLLVDEAAHMSQRSMYYRFFAPKKTLTQKELAYFTEVDYHAHVALVALVDEGDNNYIHAGCGRYIVLAKRDKAAEIAFDIKDEYQGHGIGTILFNFLCQIAREEGLNEFRAEVLAENTKMIEVFEHAGLPLKKKYLNSGVLQIRISLN